MQCFFIDRAKRDGFFNTFLEVIFIDFRREAAVFFLIFNPDLQIGFHSEFAEVLISAFCNAESHGNAGSDTECNTFSLFCACSNPDEKNMIIYRISMLFPGNSGREFNFHSGVC